MQGVLIFCALFIYHLAFPAGCRYGCICHLCKLSDSGEEKEPDYKPPCDKEYCKLGCICDSIDTKTVNRNINMIKSIILLLGYFVVYIYIY